MSLEDINNIFGGVGTSKMEQNRENPSLEMDYENRRAPGLVTSKLYLHGDPVHMLVLCLDSPKFFDS